MASVAWQASERRRSSSSSGPCVRTGPGCPRDRPRRGGATLTFTAGETSKTMEVEAHADRAAEGEPSGRGFLPRLSLPPHPPGRPGAEVPRPRVSPPTPRGRRESRDPRRAPRANPHAWCRSPRREEFARRACAMRGASSRRYGRRFSRRSASRERASAGAVDVGFEGVDFFDHCVELRCVGGDDGGGAHGVVVRS